MNDNLVLNDGRSHQENTIEMIKLLLRIRLRTGVSLFSRSVVRNVRDTKMIMHVTDGARRGRGEKQQCLFFLLVLPPLASGVSWLRRSRLAGGSLISLNPKKKRDRTINSQICHISKYNAVNVNRTEKCVCLF